jgi:sugar (pentulose or hexulose) kinase
VTTVLCVDVGTSSLKAALIDESGNVLAFARKQFLLFNTEHASKEWLPSMQNLVHELFLQRPKISPDGICISGNGPTLVAQSGETLLWNEPSPPLKTSSLFIPKIIAFKNKFSAAWEKSSFIFSGPEYLLWLLTEQAVTILPAENFRDAYWSDDELFSFGLSKDECKKFPQFVQPGKKIQPLSRKAAAFLTNGDFVLREGLPVFCGAPDFVSALVGTACVESGILCDRAGSSEGINFSCARPVSGEKIRTLPSVISGLWNASFLIPDSGSKFSDFREKIQRESGEKIEFSELVEKIIFNDGSNPSLDQGKYLMIQTALKVRDGIFTLKEAAEKIGMEFPAEMRITGGQARNVLWNQMKADITGMKIIVPVCTDAELLGDAAFAFSSMGIFSDAKTAAKSLFKIQRVFSPSESE